MATTRHDPLRRLTLGATAAAIAVVLVAYPALGRSSLRGLFVFIGIAGIGALAAAALAGWPGLVGLGLLLLLGEYAASLVTDERIDWWAPLYAAALVLLGEVILALAERRRVARPAALLRGREVLRVAAVTGLALAGGATVLSIVAIPFPEGVLIQAAGVGAATGVLVGLVSLAARRV